MTPERATAALTIRAPATMITMSSLKPENALSVGHDAGEHRGQQGQDRDQVVAQPAPDEEDHHHGEDREGEGLIESHRTTKGQTSRRTEHRTRNPTPGVFGWRDP